MHFYNASINLSIHQMFATKSCYYIQTLWKWETAASDPDPHASASHKIA